jgi:hypothetical protein
MLMNGFTSFSHPVFIPTMRTESKEGTAGQSPNQKSSLPPMLACYSLLGKMTIPMSFNAISEFSLKILTLRRVLGQKVTRSYQKLPKVTLQLPYIFPHLVLRDG